MYEECYKILMKDGEEGVDLDYIDDVCFGFGVFQILMSIIPPSFQHFIEILGFKADRIKGLDYLKICCRDRGFTGFISHIVLSAVYLWLLHDYKSAMFYVEEVFKNFPSVVWPHFIAGHVNVLAGQTEKALESFNSLLVRSENIRQLQLVCFAEMGSCSVRMSDWDNAIKYYSIFLSENKTGSYRCWLAYELGAVYCIVNEKEKAKEAFSKSIEYVRDNYSYDQFAARKSRQWLNSTDLMNEFDKFYFINDTKLMANKSKEVLSNIEEFSANEVNNEEQKGMLDYLKGRCYRQLGDYGKAIKALEKIWESGIVEEVYIKPYSLVELAEVYHLLGEVDNASSSLQKAGKFTKYDFEKPLYRRVLILKDKLNGSKY